MDKLTKDILGLTNKESLEGSVDFYFEIQEAAGGVGSSKKVHYSLLAAAILGALSLEHSDLTDLAADDHPQYLNNERGDLRYVPIGHLSDENPHPQYQTEVEVNSQIDIKVLTLKGEVDPFPQYASNAELNAEVTAAVAPIAEQKVAEYISTDAQPIIETQVQQEVAAQLPPLLAKPVANVGSVAGVLTLDLDVASNFIVNLTENITSVQLTNLPPAGEVAEIDVDFVQDATGGRTVALPASFKALGGSDTLVAAGANLVTVMVAKSKNAGATWRYAMQESG